MLGMDPVLTGSLCFLVLAILMYVRFLRENPIHEDDELHRRQLHAHGKARKSSPVEPDAVPFLHPVGSPVTGSALLLPPAMKTPLSPRQAGHHGLAVLQKAHQYTKNVQQPGYYNQAKQPMRRRAHSAATNPNNSAMATPVAPSTMVADPEMGLRTSHQTPTGSSAAPRSSHRIDFGDLGYGDHHHHSDDAPFYHPDAHHHQQPQQQQQQQHQPSLRDSMLNDDPFDTHHEETEGFDDDLESRMSGLTADDVHPAPFMIGGGGNGDQSDDRESRATTPTASTPLPTPAKPDVKTVVMERQFVRDAVPPPAQMQLEVARKARIPLFLHSPMYVKTSAAPIDDTLVGQQAAQAGGFAHDQPFLNGPGGGGGVGNVAMTPRKKDKLPARCHKNESLHIDFTELRVGEMIGQGAFGTVHRASWRGTTVAVKILVCQYLTADILEEFETEVQIMSILRHPNICLLMGACLEPPTRCLVIEYLPRGSLWNVLRQENVIEHDKQMTFARDTALGMNYLHSFQPPILHRDLKSPNLLVDTSYAIKISDFGLARVRAHFQTMTGNCGTTQWMAPEVLAAEKYTEKADVFSFGVVCWEIITRACPYDGLCQIQAALGVLNNNLRPTIPENCPPHFKKLMTLCWVSAPEKRPTFEQILEFLHSNNESSLLDDLR